MKNIAILFALLAVSTLAAQPPMEAPGKEQEWLKQFVGEWDSDSEGKMAPDQPAIKCKGTMSGKMVGGFWLINELKGDMAGMQMHGVQTVGYDTKAKKYVGTWVDSMMNLMWKYTGTVDSTGKILTLEADGPHFTQPDKTAKYRDVYEFKSKDHFVMTSSMQGDDGKWVTFMTGQVKRKK